MRTLHSPVPPFTFNYLGLFAVRRCRCESIGMNLTLILLAIQVLVTVFAFIRESGEDEQFAGDKLGYRS